MNEQLIGIFHKQNNQKPYVETQIQNTSIKIIINEFDCLYVIDGEEVKISLLTPDYWESCENGNIIQTQKPNSNYQHFIPQRQYQNIIEMILKFKDLEKKN